ncbi:DUF2815 family protein [Aurantimonas sp. MSK8Z-1]|uniref:ssDNA-binding protein n=1 Tax=Mangrovibrevibacter kandeliae TaxID=2968473 RepID=UPI0021195EBA|nr:ssDNA-binding protein [Aurantimonas sp. MSK8Z-1]MCW4115634.1 DUF2815 family protein [Aurantimonas sp. MSK8Z-1]
MAFAKSKNFKTPECCLSYGQNLFKARAVQDGGKEKFGATLIFSNAHRPFFEKILAELIVEQWGEKGIERAKAGLIKSPLLAGDGKEARNKKTGDVNPGLGADVFFIRVSTLYEPVVRYKSANIPASYGNGDDQVKSGDYGFAVLNAFAWNNSQSGDGISFGIQYFQKTRPGESLGGSGGVDANDWFEQVEDSGPAPDATKNGAGAGGLFG